MLKVKVRVVRVVSEGFLDLRLGLRGGAALECHPVDLDVVLLDWEGFVVASGSPEEVWRALEDESLVVVDDDTERVCRFLTGVRWLQSVSWETLRFQHGLSFPDVTGNAYIEFDPTAQPGLTPEMYTIEVYPDESSTDPLAVVEVEECDVLAIAEMGSGLFAIPVGDDSVQVRFVADDLSRLVERAGKAMDYLRRTEMVVHGLVAEFGVGGEER